MRDLPSVGQSWTLLSSPSSSGGLATSGESIQRKRSLYCHKCRWQLHSQEREHMFTGALHTTCVYNPSANIYAILNRSSQGNQESGKKSSIYRSIYCTKASESNSTFAMVQFQSWWIYIGSELVHQCWDTMSTTVRCLRLSHHHHGQCHEQACPTTTMDMISLLPWRSERAPVLHVSV